MLLQGTIYSDGKSSTVLSPKILNEAAGTSDSTTLDKRLVDAGPTYHAPPLPDLDNSVKASSPEQLNVVD